MEIENIEQVSHLNSEMIDIKAKRNKLKSLKGKEFKIKLEVIRLGEFEFELNLDLLLDANIILLQKEIDSLRKELDKLLNA